MNWMDVTSDEESDAWEDWADWMSEQENAPSIKEHALSDEKYQKSQCF